MKPKICLRCIVGPCCSEVCKKAKRAWLKENNVEFKTLYRWADGENMWLTNKVAKISWPAVFECTEEEIAEMKRDPDDISELDEVENLRWAEDEAAGVINKREQGNETKK